MSTPRKSTLRIVPLQPYALVFSAVSAVSVVLLTHNQVYTAFGLLSLLIGARILYLLLLSRGSIGDCIHNSAIFVYFCIAPGLQWAQNASFWGASTPTTASLGTALSMVAIYCAGYEFSKVFVYTKTIENSERFRISPARLLVSMVTMSFVAVVILLLNANYALQPRGQAYLLDPRSAAYAIFLTILPKSALLVSLVLSTLLFKWQKRWITAMAVIYFVILCIYFVSPVHTARQQLIIGLLPIPILFLQGFFYKKLATTLVILLGLTSVGPILNSVARDQFHGVETTSFPMSADFDAMFNAASISSAFSRGELGLGRYTLNALSFPLPGQLKLFPEFDPLQTDTAYYLFSQVNVSMPPFVTVYLDFGYIGCFVLGAAIGYVMRWASTSCFRSGQDFAIGTALQSAIVLASYTPFIRGPVQGMGPFPATMLLAAYVLLVAVKRRKPSTSAGMSLWRRRLPRPR